MHSTAMIRLVTWNVNSITARFERVYTYLKEARPSIVCFQELKCLEEKFPREAFESLGYHCAIHGQKTYNGVAILSLDKIEAIQKGFENSEWDVQSRWIGAKSYGMRIYNAYVPNGQAVDSEKYHYKLGWLAELEKYLKNNTEAIPTAIVGDFNVAPEDKDVYDPIAWKGQLLVSDRERNSYQKLLQLGFQDLFRKYHLEEKLYSWWDYRQLSFPKNKGLRIDLILTNPLLWERSRNCWIERDQRKGHSPSDHAPVLAEFDV